MFTSSVKKDFSQSPYAERTRVRTRAKTIGDVLVIIVRKRDFSFSLSLSLSIVLSTMHYFNMIFIFTLFFSHEFAYIDRSERKIVNVIATWRYERGKRETGRRVSRLSIGGDTVLRYMYVGCNGSSAKSPGSRRKTSPGSSLMD